MASSSSEKRSHETITLESELETETEDFIRRIRHHLRDEVRESIGKMTLSMSSYQRKQENCEINISSIKANLNDLRQLVFNSLPLATSHSSESPLKQVFAAASKKICGNIPRKKDELDEETSLELIKFLINEIEEATFKLEENINDGKNIQLINEKHLKNMEKAVREAEVKLVQEERRKAANPYACPKCITPKPLTKFTTVAVNTENLEDSTKSSIREFLQGENNLNPSKRLKLEAVMSSPSTSKARSGDYQSKQAEDGDNNLCESEIIGSKRSVEDHLVDADNYASELRRRINTFEEFLVENRSVLNCLTESLDSIWNANREEKKNRELEKLAAETEFMQNYTCWNQTLFSQGGPSSAENDPSTPKKNLSTAECTGFGTPNKGYLDTHSATAQDAIKRTIGPLSSEKMTCFLDEVRKKQNVIYLIRRFTSDVCSLLQQLKWVKSNLEESYKIFINEPGNRSTDFDRRLLQRLETLIKTIERCV